MSLSVEERIEWHRQAAAEAKARGDEETYRRERKAMLLAQAEMYQRREERETP